MFPARLSRVRLLLLLAFGFCALLPRGGAQPVHFRTRGGSPAHVRQTPPSAGATTCQAQWLPTFGGRSGCNASVRALTSFDDGSGPGLYVGGYFTTAGGVPASEIAKWDGAHWTALGSGLNGTFGTVDVEALVGFDDGSGPALYAGGNFASIGGIAASNLARWDGQQWSAIGGGLAGIVRALAVYDDGSGPALYAGGDFFTAGGVLAKHVARWDGVQWSDVGGGLLGGWVNCLQVYDDGQGRALYAGGAFSQGGGQACTGIAKWDGSSWSPVGGGVLGGVQALTVYDDGSTSRLCVGGGLSSAGGLAVNRIALWDGSAWSALGSGLDYVVGALATFDDGSGPALYVGGEFSNAGGVPASCLAKWDGVAWSALPVQLDYWVQALCVFDGGGGPALIGGGSFGQTDQGQSLHYVGSWDGSAWSGLGDGMDLTIAALASFDDGTGPALFAAVGQDTSAVPQDPLRRWDGQAWSVPAGGPNAGVAALAVHDDGSGPALYVGGAFTLAGGAPANGIARWRNGTWTTLGTGLHRTSGPALAMALAVYDDGTGPALFVGGDFDHAGTTSAHNIARWDGTAWSALGSGTGTAVYTLATHDEGNGPALFAGGNFYVAGGLSVDNIARWDGSAWSAVGMPLVGFGFVACMASFDDGGGPALYVGGNFQVMYGSMGNGIAKWNGLQWSSLGSGLEGGGAGSSGAYALGVFDLGTGPRLFVGGRFATAGGSPAAAIASWDGNSWSPVGSGMLGGVSALCTFDDGGGPALHAGGWFLSCIDSGDSGLAKWGLPPGCGYSGAVICEPGVGGVIACPCSNPPGGLGRGCDNSSATGGAVLAASGQSSLASDTLVLTASGETPSALSLVLQGNALSPSGAGFGQGVRCTTGALRRLYVRNAVAGSITAPGPGDPSVSARSAALGDAIAQGLHRYYGVYYRDPNVLGGCPATSAFNITRQLDVLWQP
jgi:hypothetical protein